MHEYAVAQDIVRSAVAEALCQQEIQIAALHIKLGPEGLTSREALAFSIQAACQGTIAEGADVRITEAQEEGVVLESIEFWEARPCVQLNLPG